MERKLEIIYTAYKSQLDGIVNCEKIRSRAIHYGMFAEPYSNPPALAEPLKANHARHHVPRVR